MHICTEQLIEYFSGKRRVFDIPIVQEGTEFQQKVWGHLYEIDYGKTISYVDLAKKMGDANTTRAVANANAKNRIALINPCHRVIGSDKNLTGYAWGLWRKKWLLQHEFRILHGIQTLF
jgi:methylated-DNA-[protein]-cysteine S-methyltransferase